MGELHNPVIEKRRKYFDRVRHAGPVHLGQDVVRQKILLIEVRKQPLQFGGSSPANFREHRIECTRQLSLYERAFFLVAERSAPINVRPRRR